MLVANADSDGHRHDTAKHCSPVRDNETLIRPAENDQLVSGLHPPGLQGAQQREGAVPQFLETNNGLVVFAIDETYVAVPVPRLAEEFCQCCVEFHAFLTTGCSLMSDAERRFTARSSPGPSASSRIIRNFGSNRPR